MQTVLIRLKRRVTRIQTVWHSNNIFTKFERHRSILKIEADDKLVSWLRVNILYLLVLQTGTILEYSDPSALLLFFTLFCIATIVKCFLISVFFSRANLAACCAGFIYFLLYLPYMLMLQFDDVLTKSVKKAVVSLNYSRFRNINWLSLFQTVRLPFTLQSAIVNYFRQLDLLLLIDQIWEHI